MSADPDAIIALYERHADTWDRSRSGELVLEREWMARLLSLVPAAGAILDIGCGCGQPIAKYLIEHGFGVVGVDSSARMIAKCRARWPDADWQVADMRSLALGRTFQGLIAWDSFFHLSQADQRAMFPIFGQHAAAGAPLMFTSGTGHGEAIGSYQGEPLYHASLAPEEYRSLLEAHGFSVVAHRVADPDCGGHTIWLARKNGEPA